MKKTIVFVGFFIAIGAVGYWTYIFLGFSKVIDIVPGYKNWFMSFPLADSWTATCALLSSIFLLKNNEKSVIFGFFTGSCLIFLALHLFIYEINTGLFFNITVEEIIEIFINIFCLIIGAMYIIYNWKSYKHKVLQNRTDVI